MKCPYCHIHYMDDERECPICGERNPNVHKGFGQKKPVIRNVPIRYNTAHAFRMREENENTEQNAVKWAKRLVPIIIILLVVNGIYSGIMNYREELPGIVEELFGTMERPPESAYMILEGEWEGEQTEDTLSIHVEDLEYSLITAVGREDGQIEFVEEAVRQDVNGYIFHLYKVKFHPKDAEEYTCMILGQPESRSIAVIPADTDVPDEEDIQNWNRKN